MRYIRPVYKALYGSRMGRDLARRTFNECRGFYHPIAQKLAAQDVGLTL